jgi:hypothetical protein
MHLVLRLRGGDGSYRPPGRVNDLHAALAAQLPQLLVDVTAPDGQQYTLTVDTLAPVAALGPLLQHAMITEIATVDERGDADEPAASQARARAAQRERQEAEEHLAVHRPARRED